MNWTGGRLANTGRGIKSSKGIGLTAQQKRHYARIRTTIAAPLKPPPVTLTVETSGAKSICQNTLDPYCHTVAFPCSRTPAPIVKDETVPPNEDYYNATPPLRRPKRIRLDREEEEQLIEAMKEKNGIDLTDQRRNILSKDDWGLGLKVLQPPRHLYKRASQDKAIGRRRRPQDGQRARFEQRWESSTENAVLTDNRHRLRSHQKRLAPSSHTQSAIRISIGSIQPTNNASLTLEPSSHRCNQRAPSETMMLDTFERTNRHEKRLSSNISQLYLELSHPSASNDGSGAGTENSSRSFQSHREQSDTVEDSHHCLNSKSPDSLNDPLGSNGENDGSLLCLYPSSKKLRTSISNHTSCTSKTKSDYPSKRQIISSVNICHPRPERYDAKRFLSRILESKDYGPAVADSTTAELGQANPVVSSSQELENEIWNTWLIPSDDESCQDGRHHVAKDVSISPGPSSEQFYLPTDDEDLMKGINSQGMRKVSTSGKSLDESGCMQFETTIPTSDSPWKHGYMQHEIAAGSGSASTTSYETTRSPLKAQLQQKYIDSASFKSLKSHPSTSSVVASSSSTMMLRKAEQDEAHLPQSSLSCGNIVRGGSRGSTSYSGQDDSSSLLVERSLEMHGLTQNSPAVELRGAYSGRIRDSQLNGRSIESKADSISRRIREQIAEQERGFGSWPQHVTHTQNL